MLIKSNYASAFYIVSVLLFSSVPASSQDSIVNFEKKVITLKEVVVRSHLDVPSFVRRVQLDTSFYKAFRNLKVLGYTSLNDVRMLDKNGAEEAVLQSRTRQTIKDTCRSMEVLEEKKVGDVLDRNGNWNYYTLEMYAGLMFAKGLVCGEDNIVKDADIETKNKSGIAKHKEQLKMLFFNPGKKIPGIPFIGNKIAIFDEDVAKRYDFIIDMETYQGGNCYVFRIKKRDDLTRSEKNDIVINEMTTWFNQETMEIVARNYDLSYDAGLYDFDVHMEVQLQHFGEYLVPALIRYNGNWHVTFKKRERGVFTATLFDFNKPDGN